MKPGATPGLYPMAVVERLTGLTRRQIRYCESRGLVNPGRSRGGQRLFSPEEVETLVAIKQLRQLGYYPLEHIKELLSLPGRQSSSPGRAGFAWKRSLSLAEHAEPGDARQHFQKPRELHRRVKGTGPRERR